MTFHPMTFHPTTFQPMTFQPMTGQTDEVISIVGAEDPYVDAQTLARLAEVVPAATAVAPFIAPPSRFDMAWQPSVTRAGQIARTMDRARSDDRFLGAIARADAARDARHWPEALQEYGMALQLWPLHWGYCIQYAHMAKEQGSHLLAEIYYRSAVALGAVPDMVDPHLAYVARASGSDFVRCATPDLDVAPMLAPPTVHDLRLLGALTRVRGLSDEAWMLDLLRHMPDNRAVLMQMLQMPEFARNNRDLLDVVQADHG